MRSLALLLVMLAVPALHAGAGERTVVHAGTLLATPGEAPLENASVVIEDGRILSVEPGFIDAAPNDQLVDLRCCFVLPGLLDLHVHLTTPVGTEHKSKVVTATAADLTILAVTHGRATLEAGFTTVLDLGTGHRNHEEAIYAYRDATARHALPGPRVLAVGSPISPTGLSRTAKFRAEVESVVGPEGVCNGADDCRRAVREQVRRGADIINFYNTGSLLDDYIVPQTFTLEEMQAIVETGHALGRKVIADGHTAMGVNAALRAGADIVDTVPWPDEETWRLLQETGAYFAPHLYAFEASVGDLRGEGGAATMSWMPAHIVERMRSIMEQPYSATPAHQRGVPMVFASDTGVIHHGDNAHEFIELVKAGLSPMEALVAATTNAATAIGLGAEAGRLAPGYAADIVAVEGNPLEDIRALLAMRFVMRGGMIYRQ